MARKDKSLDQPTKDERCSYHAGSQRCYFPWTISDSVKGGSGLCRFHWRCENPQVGLETIKTSHAWFTASRKGLPVPATYTRFDGKVLQGFKTRALP